MTTEKKAPTAEDVQSDRESVRSRMVTRPAETERYVGALDRLRDLAMLGVQVPGLQSQLEAARDSEHAARVRAMEHATKADALQARVAELEQRERVANADRAVMREYADRFKTAESERDALRAQVERLTHAVANAPEGKARVAFRDALSAPPAEAKTAEAPKKRDAEWLDSEDPATPCPNCGERRDEHRDYGTASLCRLR